MVDFIEYGGGGVIYRLLLQLRSLLHRRRQAHPELVFLLSAAGRPLLVIMSFCDKLGQYEVNE